MYPYIYGAGCSGREAMTTLLRKASFLMHVGGLCRTCTIHGVRSAESQKKAMKANDIHQACPVYTENLQTSVHRPHVTSGWTCTASSCSKKEGIYLVQTRKKKSGMHKICYLHPLIYLTTWSFPPSVLARRVLAWEKRNFEGLADTILSMYVRSTVQQMGVNSE